MDTNERQLDELVGGSINAYKGRMHGQTDRRMDGQMDGLANEQIDGRVGR